MALINSTAIPSGATFEIEQSLRFDDGRSTNLSFTPSTTGNRKTWTWSCWVKRGNLSLGAQATLLHSYSSGNQRTELVFNTDNKLQFRQGTASAGDNDQLLTTTQVFRDTSSFYHIMLVADFSNGTASSRAKIYVNGLLATATFSTDFANADGQLPVATKTMSIGGRSDNRFFDGYLGEVNFIDGTAKAPADFGETGTYGEWKPIEYSGSYGTNGFYLPFKQDYTVEGFSTVTWAGTGVQQYIGGVGFQPDFLLSKRRSGADNGMAFDSVRGVTKRLLSNATDAEATSTTILKSFDTDGFTVGTDNYMNYAAGHHYVAWCWDMGGSNANNTTGSINSVVRANPSYGQSIVSWTGDNGGATIGHGLSSAPEMIILKERGVNDYWYTYHVSVGNTKTLNLAGQEVETSANFWGNTTPTANVFTVGGSTNTNNSSGIIAYCFHSVSGYSKFSSYTGNGNANHAITGLGFEPAFLLIKRTNSAHDWVITDNTRNPNEPLSLLANTSDAESNQGGDDVSSFDSNGFTLGVNARVNGNNDTYIYMAFADKREYAYWLDQSGNNNDWTSNNLTESDISVDSPTNNFSTMNPLANANSSAGTHDSDSFTVSEGNLKTRTAGAADGRILNTIMPTTGKWYFEFVVTEVAESNRAAVSVGEYDSHLIGQEDQAGKHYMLALGAAGNDRLWYYGNEKDDYNYTTAVGDVWQFAFDITGTTHKIWIRQNAGNWFGTNSATFASGSPAQSQNKSSINTAFYVSHVSTSGSSSSASTVVFNFGQDSSFAGNKTAQGNQDSGGVGDFYYAPPSGFLALCTSNLPDVAVIPSEHFNTVLYSGNGSTQSITGLGFAPNFSWFKSRSNATSHNVYDSVRGGHKYLLPDLTAAEQTGANGFVSLDSDGFSLNNAGGGGEVNVSGRTYVAWNWKANGSGSSNTNGSINSTVSANVDAGFSIVSYTGNATSGATVGHGLSKAPELILLKNRDNTSDFLAYSKGAGPTKFLRLSSHVVADTSSAVWNNTAPDATKFTLGNSSDPNANGDDYIAYAFHSVDGYSAVGVYVGNLNVDGPFQFTGFRPSFVICKAVDHAKNWNIYDSLRSPHNEIKINLDADNTNADYVSGTYNAVDFLSNGFKIKNNNTTNNNNGTNYIYIAFAETPFKYSNAR